MNRELAQSAGLLEEITAFAPTGFDLDTAPLGINSVEALGARIFDEFQAEGPANEDFSNLTGDTKFAPTTCGLFVEQLGGHDFADSVEDGAGHRESRDSFRFWTHRYATGIMGTGRLGLEVFFEKPSLRVRGIKDGIEEPRWILEFARRGLRGGDDVLEIGLILAERFLHLPDE